MYVHPLLSLPATRVARWSSRSTCAWGFRKCFLCPPKAIKFTKSLTSLWKCKTSGPALACLEDPFAVPMNRTAEVTLLWCTNSRMLHFGAELKHSCVLLHKILASGTTAVFPVFPQWPLYSESEWRISHCLGPIFFCFQKTSRSAAVWQKMMEWVLSGCDHWRKGLKTQDVNQKQPVGYFTVTGGLIHDAVPLDDNGGGLFHSSVCITPALHFATSRNPKACQGKRYLLCTYVCGA